MPQSPSRHTPHAPLRRWRLPLFPAVIFLGLGAILAGLWHGRSQATPLSELAGARPSRGASPQFSIAVEYHPCSVLRKREEETVPRESCGADPARLAHLEALADAGASSDPDSLQASALLSIIGDDQTEHAADSAIERLSRALLLSRRRAPLLVDLAAAHLVRAQRTQNARDILAGMDHALEAVELEPRNTAARFNAALAMQMWGLDEEAEIAWTEYLRIDSTSKWAGEARARRRLLRHPRPPRAPRSGAPDSVVRAFARAYPQRARLIGLDSVLGEWGAAQRAGNRDRAAALLKLAERLGAPLNDSTLASAVLAIQAAERDAEATRILARAHRTYAAGQRLYGNSDQVTAGDSFSAVLNAQPPSLVLRQSAELFSGGAKVYSLDRPKADSIFRALIGRLGAAKYPAFTARAHWMRGSGRLRNNDYAEARSQYQVAADLFLRAGETEFVGTVWGMDGEAAHRQRDTVAAYNSLHRSMTILREYRSSGWLHNTLLVLANCAALDGMHRAAARIQDEDITVTMRIPDGPHAPEALMGRARISSINRFSPQAARDLARAESLVAKISAEEIRTRLQETLNYSRAVVAPDSAPIEKLDDAVAFFLTKDNSEWLLPALLRRADWHVAHGNIADATADLDTATARIRALSDTVLYASLRTAVMEKARERFDQLAMLHLRAGNTTAALRAVERGRVSLAPRFGGSATDTGRVAAPAGQVAVEYALIGDTLLTWTLRGTDVRMLRRTVKRANIVGMIERSVGALQSPDRAASAGHDLEALYDTLIRPIENRLGPAETPVVILADGEIAGVPFAALRDKRRSRYLVEDHPLRFAATLAEAGRRAPPNNGSVQALLVADPAFDRAQYPTLDRLQGARAEVAALSRQYPGGVVLRDTGATRAAFRERAARASVIHYAGHAVFDDSRPERSSLVLAGADTTGRLTAKDVNDLDLRGVRLVVLAACRTVRARDGRSGGLAGFSGALIAAGAGGVVGSQWDANDRPTQALMLEFHRAYDRSSNATRALREAQLAMLHSPDSARRSPAAWAGFRYIGR